MTFTEDDLDRLADYVAGVLDPAEESTVAALVGDDPAWAAAYDGLVAADTQVGTQLRAAANDADDAMPTDVMARITSALDAAGRDRPRAVTRTPWENLRRTLRRHAGVVALGTAAAALVAVVGGGLVSGALPSGQSKSDSAAGPAMADGSAADRSPAVAGGSALAAVPDDADLASTAVISTDAEYSWATLPLAAGTAYSAAKTAAREVPVPAALSALSAPDALRACLDAVVAAVGGTPVRAEFARYDGAPALVVILTRTGATSVAAVGPACGPGHADVQAVRSVA